MLSHFDVSIILLIVWGLAFLRLRKKLISSKAYFILLFFMGSAGLFLPLNKWMDIGTPNDFNFFLIVLFAILLVCSIIPWIKFDKCFSNVEAIRFNPSMEGGIRIVLVVMILMAVYAIAYTLPYAVIGYMMGAGEVRALIVDDSILPVNIFSTIALGVGFLAPIYILLFYLCLCSQKLKGFAFPIFIASGTYLVTTAPAQARDGFIMIPLTYFFLYQVFKPMLPSTSIKTVKRLLRIAVPILLIFFLVITLDRFFNDVSGDRMETLMKGTWGYFYEQPYVFDQTVQHQVYFHGITNKFPLLGNMLGIPSTGRHIDFRFEYSFGTQYASFYHATGWSSLIVASLFFILSWTVLIGLLHRGRNYFGMLIVFSLYLFFLISGLFYFRLADESITIAYLIIMLLAFFVKRYVIVEYKQ